MPHKLPDLTVRNRLDPVSYQVGIGQTRYRRVPEWMREESFKFGQDRRNVRFRTVYSPMTKDLLDGETLFAYDPFGDERNNRHGAIFATLYNTARRYGKVFRCVSFLLHEGNRTHQGYVLWMDDLEEAAS